MRYGSDGPTSGGHLERAAIKILQPSTLQQFRRLNLDARATVRREWLALNRVMDREVPTELIVGVYGNGDTRVEVEGRSFELPWLALEYVDGGAEGTTLAQRVANARRREGGVDPVRVLRLADRLFRGVKILHDLDIVHKDLKPDNIFVSGPIDNETPKIGDCGIATVPGVSRTIYGVMTQQYAGPEQALSSNFPTRQNPVLGPWTDVHALSALVWFLIAGEDWCRGDQDNAWSQGERRSLLQSSSLHEGFQRDAALLDRLDGVLRSGAAYRPPDIAWRREGATPYRTYVEKSWPQLLMGTERFASTVEFWEALVPVLKEAADSWRRYARSEQRAATAFRATRVLDTGSIAVCKIVGTGTGRSEPLEVPITPELVAMHVDGRMLVKSGQKLLQLLDTQRSVEVDVPDQFAEQVAQTRWITRGPREGYALWTHEQVLLLSTSGFQPLPLPERATPGGAIEAVLGDGRAFAVVVEGQLWRWRSNGWDAAPLEPPISHTERIVSGPDGLLVLVGAGPRPNRPAVVLVRHDGLHLPTVPASCKLTHAVCGIGQVWVAGEEGLMIRIAADGVTTQPVECRDGVIDLGLDPVGVPWLLTARGVCRLVGSRWGRCYERQAEEPPFVALGFTPAGVRLADEWGRITLLEPSDVGDWRRG